MSCILFWKDKNVIVFFFLCRKVIKMVFLPFFSNIFCWWFGGGEQAESKSYISRVWLWSQLMLHVETSVHNGFSELCLVGSQLDRFFSAWTCFGVSSLHFQCTHPRTQHFWIYISSSCREILDRSLIDGINLRT